MRFNHDDGDSWRDLAKGVIVALFQVRFLLGNILHGHVRLKTKTVTILAREEG